MLMPIDLENIITKAKNGDKISFGILVKKYQQFAFNLAFRVLCNEDDAKDVVQDSFVKIWKNIKLYNPKVKFTTWMYRIVINTAIDHQRSTMKRNDVSITDFHENFEQLTEDNPEKQLDNKETGQFIRLATDTLSEKQKLIFVMRDLQGLSSAEVCEILNLSFTTIKSNLYHARKAVKDKLQSIFSYERSTI
jgi:RNA polymerase sigma-70 factor, ECF subfamily